MSYDFKLKFPRTKTRRGAKSTPAQTIDYVARAAEILRQHEPDIVIKSDDGRFTAFSAELGEVHVTERDIALGMSLGSDPRAVYGAIHGLMRRFDGEGYETVDPQLMRGTVEYSPDFPTFMRQYREHFKCPTAEFEQWCRGETPPEWAARDARREDGQRRAKELPRGNPLTYEQQREMNPDALWAHFLEIVARNDAAIEAMNLRGYFDDLETLHQAKHEGYRPMPSPSGRHYDSMWFEEWFQTSLLRYEQGTLAMLWQRGQSNAMAYYLRRYTLRFPDAPEDKHEPWRDLIVALIPLLRDEGLIASEPMGVRVGNELQTSFDGPDIDAIHCLVWPRVVASGLAIEATMQYGSDRAKAVEMKLGEGV